LFGSALVNKKDKYIFLVGQINYRNQWPVFHLCVGHLDNKLCDLKGGQESRVCFDWNLAVLCTDKFVACVPKKTCGHC